MLCIADKEGKFVELNPRWSEVLGYSADELLSQPYINFVHPDDQERTITQAKKILQENKRIISFENRYRKKDGSYIWLSWNSTLSSDGYLYAVAREITSDKDMRMILEKLQEAGKIGFWSFAEGDTSPTWSSGTYKIHGVSLEDQVQLSEAIDFYVGESRERITQDFGASLEEGSNFDGVYRFKSKDGVLKWVRSIGIPKLDSAGKVKEVQGIFQDVTKEKQFEEKIEAYGKRLELALATSEIGVWEYNISDSSLAWDERMFSIYGTKPENFSGTVESWNQSLHPDDLEKAQQDLQSAPSNNGIFNSEFRILFPNGEVRFIKAKAQTLYDSKGAPSKMIGVNWDITDSKMNAELLRTEKEKAVQASKAKSDFLSHMSHEIRTPMNGMLGYLSLLSESQLDQEQEGFVKTILESASSLHSLINDILDYSKIEAGKMTLSVSLVEIGSLIEKVCSLFRASIAAKGVVLKSEIKIMESGAALIDEVRVKQILSNILGNAAKFTHKGEIVVSASYDQINKSMIFKVRDTGIGIDTNQIKKIFDPFQQSEDSVLNTLQGTGLGLAIVNQLIQLMAGKITCESIPGQGSEFTVSIPAELSSSNSERSTTQAKKSMDFRAKENKLVLVVDDNPTNRTLIKLRLEKMGVESDLVESGEEAIEKVKKVKYDLIFMDINMPGMDGYTAAKEIYALLKVDSPPIYALTANAFEDDIKKTMKNGLAGHLSKPISKDDLYKILEQANIGKAS